MKKIIMLFIILIASAITIYSVAFWEPSDNLDDKKIYLESMNENNSTGIGKIKNTKTINENDKKETDYASSAVSLNNPIYKIDKDEIKERISKEEWEKVRGIIKEMSIVDIERIRAAEENGEEGVKEVFNILGTRLSAKNYKVIEGIFNPYIDFSSVQERV